ncbi:hypothetical protein F2Q68_00031258 [Brassica cretica]|uniref:Uncharacterized protein n=1 Tax=Brassica cretica TaxID=69181 RepID=A0A8S9G4R2_BRACR|nr:hypothetical protein F2Q68_00031258 [Brassica cretica]
MITESSSCFYSAITHSFPMILSCPFDGYHPCQDSSNPSRSSSSQLLMKSFPNEVLFLTICPVHTKAQFSVSVSPLSLRVWVWPRTPSTLRFSSLKVPINEHTYSLQFKRTLHTQVSR